MNASTISAFVDELEKDAVAPELLRRIWSSGAGRSAVGSLVGAGAGALANPENRLGGAIAGGTLGAGLGFAAPIATKAGRKAAWGRAKDMAYKAKYELTGRGNRLPAVGKVSPEELRSLRKADRMGLTSIPGVVKGMATHPLSTLRNAWQQGGKMGKVFTVGSLALDAPHVMDPNTQEGMGEKALGSLGTATGYMLGGRMGMLGSTALGSGLGFAGKRVGRLFGGGKVVPAGQVPVNAEEA